jgi:hypothetical protein
MIRRLLLCPIVIAFVVAGALRAEAQAVIVQSAPARSAIELSLNGGPPVSAVADANGDAQLVLPGHLTDSVLQMRVDLCVTAVHVVIIEKGVAAPAAAPGCFRVDVGRTFGASAATTFVIDISGQNVDVHVRQGPAPASWLRAGSNQRDRAVIHWAQPVKGIDVFGSAGLSSLSESVLGACGNAPTCQSTSITPLLSAGAGGWITKFLGAQVSVVRPSDATATGGGDGYTFDTRVAMRMTLLAARAGVPVGPARIYGLGGADYLESTSTTVETLTADKSQQTLAQKSTGWSWMVGGGVEGWASSHLAIYGEFVVANAKGTPIAGGLGGVDDKMLFGVIGARLRIGR